MTGESKHWRDDLAKRYQHTIVGPYTKKGLVDLQVKFKVKPRVFSLFLYKKQVEVEVLVFSFATLGINHPLHFGDAPYAEFFVGFFFFFDFLNVYYYYFLNLHPS